MTRFDWTDERMARLKQLWDSGHSASQIAMDLRGVSRNAVIGKLRRLGMTRTAEAIAISKSLANATGRAATPHHTRAKPVTVKAAPVVRGNGVSSVTERAIAGAVAAAVWIPPREPDPPPAPRVRATPVGLLAWAPGRCRWPVNDPPSGAMHQILFCAEDVTAADRDAGRVYCPEHHAAAHQPGAPRSLKGLEKLDRSTTPTPRRYA